MIWEILYLTRKPWSQAACSHRLTSRTTLRACSTSPCAACGAPQTPHPVIAGHPKGRLYADGEVQVLTALRTGGAGISALRSCEPFLEHVRNKSAADAAEQRRSPADSACKALLAPAQEHCIFLVVRKDISSQVHSISI